MLLTCLRPKSVEVDAPCSTGLTVAAVAVILTESLILTFGTSRNSNSCGVSAVTTTSFLRRGSNPSRLVTISYVPGETLVNCVSPFSLVVAVLTTTPAFFNSTLTVTSGFPASSTVRILMVDDWAKTTNESKKANNSGERKTKVFLFQNCIYLKTPDCLCE